MTLTDEKSIEKAIRADNLASPILIYGEEEYLKQRVLQRLMSQTNDAFAAFNNVRIDFAQLDEKALEEAVTTLPLMAGRRNVLLFDVVPGKITAERLKWMKQLFSDLDNSCRLILLEKTGAVNEKRDEKSKKLLTFIDQCGTVLRLGERTPAALQKMIVSEAAKLGCSITPAAVKILLGRCGSQIDALHAETEKLCAWHEYAGEITEEDVVHLTVQQPEENIYGLSRAILRGNYDQAMQILADLMYLRYPPESILGTLSGCYVDLYRAKAASIAKKQIAEVAADFGYGKRTFAVENAMRDQRRLRESELVYALDVLGRTDLRLKSTQCDARIVLEETVTALFVGGEAS